MAVSAFAASGKTVSYKSGDETVQGILYAPEGKGPLPALLVIHEYWGLNDWVKEQAAKLADRGYATLAIDLYRGKVATTPDEAHEIMGGVREDRAARDLHAAVEFLKIAVEREERPYRLYWLVHGRRILAPGGAAGAHLGRSRDQLRAARRPCGFAEED